MLRRPVCPSDVSMAVLLDLFITCGREQNVEFSLNPMLPMQIMCFLQDTIHEEGCMVFATEAAFNAQLESFIGPDTDFAARLCTTKVIDSVEDLIAASEDLGATLASPADVSPNGAVSPTMISADSYLGVYLRSWMVAMDCMSFEAHCCLLNQILPYRGIEDAISGRAAAVGTADEGPLRKAHRAALAADFHEAEEQVHAFFDLHEPLKEIGTDSYEHKAGGTAAGPNTARRHQQAMLNMASVATQTGNFRQALTAVEEAMKIAHQRGDHASVAQALLLLHYVVEGMEAGQKGSGKLEGNAFAISALSVLIRCLNQCVATKMNHLLVQATVLYVKSLCENGSLKSRAQRTDEVSGEVSPACRADDMWLLLHAATAGEVSVLTQTLEKCGIRESNAAGAIAGSSPLEDPWSASDRLLFSAQAAHTAARLWMRLGFPGMAALQCRRILRQVCGGLHRVSPILLGDVLAAVLSISALLCATDTALTATSATPRCDGHLKIASEICQESVVMLKSFCSHSAIKELNSSQLLISMLSSPNAQDAALCCSGFIALHGLVDQGRGAVTATEVKGRLLMALCTCLSEADTALEMLQEAEERAQLGGVLYGKELAIICRAVVLKFMGAAYQGQNFSASLLLLESAMSVRGSASYSNNRNGSSRGGSATPSVIEGIIAVLLDMFSRNASLQDIFIFLLPSTCYVCI